jgi:hypothetical protein
MVWTLLKIVIAIGVALTLYIFATKLIRPFTVPPPEEPEPGDLEPVDLRYRCTVCGAEVTMTAAPGGLAPEAPRHCREDMVLVADAAST